jgi:predicted dehydrogenase
MNWLVVGIGDITTKRVIPAIQAEPRSILYGIVTRDPAKGEPYRCKVWTSLTDALQDPAIDAVYIATPVYLHGPSTLQSLQAGKHVLCEKPMAMNYQQAMQMVQAAKLLNKVFGVSYYRRTYPKVQRAMQLLEQNIIGRPTLAIATFHFWHDGSDTMRQWLFDPVTAGGGPLYDVGSHRIDLMNFFFGKPQRVTAQLGNGVHKYAVEDNATVLIEYAEGVRAIVDVRWNSHVVRDEFRIIGTNGELELTPLNDPPLGISPGQPEQWPTHANIHYPCVENFVSAVLDGAPLLSSGETALWTDWVTAQAVSA